MLFFQLSVLPSHIYIESLLCMQAGVLYLQSKPLLLQQCGKEIQCTIPAMKGEIFLGQICFSPFIVLNILMLQLRILQAIQFPKYTTSGQRNLVERASFVPTDSCSTLSVLPFQTLVHVLSWLIPHGTCIHLLHTMKLDLFSVSLCVFDNVI